MVGISLTVTMVVDPMPITLSWHVAMSTDRFPHASWIIWLTNRLDPTTGVGDCSSLGSSRVQGDWLLCRVFAISVNPSGGTHSQIMVPSIKVSMLGLKVASGLELSTCHRGTRNRVTGVATLMVLLSLEVSPSSTVVAMAVAAMPLIM